MIVACEHRLFLATCGVKQKPEIPRLFAPQTFSHKSLRHSHFAIMWLVCSTERKQTANTKVKECGSDVSSRFFGGSVAWLPRKRLRRRLYCFRLNFNISKLVYWTITVPKSTIYQSEAASNVLTSYDIKSLTCMGTAIWSLGQIWARWRGRVV